jgi:predicted enzyme related to lactoylglutathione lyase
MLRSTYQQGAAMNLNSVMIGSEDAKRLADYYTKLFGEPDWSEQGFTGWQLGAGSLTVGPHDEVKGSNPDPGRIICNIETADVQGEFERVEKAGAIVVREPYEPRPGGGMWIATLADLDNNYFQLMSPMGPSAD